MGVTGLERTAGRVVGAQLEDRLTGERGVLRASVVVNATGAWADQVRPVSGNYLDGNPPDGSYHLGCSVHWFEPHPTFRNGGVVAMASYENGTRFQKIGSDGQITEVGFFEPLGGATSAPHWAPDGRTVYEIDYQRGIDVLRYDGPLYIGGRDR